MLALYNNRYTPVSYPPSTAEEQQAAGELVGESQNRKLTLGMNRFHESS
jgi:hypothetical protein